MDRKRIADALEECGVLLELKGENPFRCLAYQNAARAIQRLERPLEEVIASGELSKIKGIGPAMAEKIKELATTGRLEFLDALKTEVEPGLIQMLRISGFGPKRIRQVHDSLGISDIEQLRLACRDGRITSIKGFGDKLVQNILRGIEFIDSAGQRVLLSVALERAEALRDLLAGHPSAKRIEICGSVRRGRSTIKDIDLLVASDDPEPIMDRFLSADSVLKVTGHGPTKSSIVLENGMNADLRVVPLPSFPFALHYFTGSKEHNVAMRARAQARGLKLNEYALAGPKKSIDCKEESDLFEALGLEYIPPELREDTGEIDAAEARSLPRLLDLENITGVFHCHTNASDGADTLADMAAAAQQLGHAFLGIADHSKTAAYAHGLEPERVLAQHKQIDLLNKKFKGFRLYKGIESDILADGSLDYDDEILARFDYVVASVHQPLNMDEATMTERVLRAIRHPRCTMLGHPTGRLLLQRDGFPIDVERVLVEAAQRGVMIEINANPHRLDLDWVQCKRAKALGVTMVINPDAHSTAGLRDTRFGVLTARRGWLEKKDVFNASEPATIDARLAQRRQAAGESP